ncbi:hypothetical protein Micbo1qcDRAFT_223755 [Microdochium bolleyi]|uniref:Berberine/berberine-like domain-containing protein n=1 Tax=Microdochium bolleyi TaxID=196109 RepID=A0A136J350_9PEZI|nr:hypothetical protein Micbo1qcDRAFT_223755 [Microdochium bolleyi]
MKVPPATYASCCSNLASEGFNGVSNGITIDFGHLNATPYIAASDIASVQPGSDWGGVYESLDPFGVTAEGSSGNFGSITRLDLDIVDNMGNQEAGSEALTAMLANHHSISHTASISNSRGVIAPESLSSFLALPDLFDNTVRDIMAKVVPIFTAPGGSWRCTQAKFPSCATLTPQLALYTSRIRAAAPSSVFQILIELQPVTAAMVVQSTSNDKGGNIFGRDRVVADGPAVMFLLALAVDTKENRAIVLPLVHKSKKTLNDIMTDEGHNRAREYAPYAWKDQDPLSHYGEDNVKLMQDLSRLDPDGVFQRLHISGFKITSAATAATTATKF